MLAASRRIYVYWLLLLLPTLAAGVGALALLRREQTRLDEQAKMASATKTEAIAARAQLIAESVELLMGDVQTGLMTTLNQLVTKVRSQKTGTARHHDRVAHAVRI